MEGTERGPLDRRNGEGVLGKSRESRRVSETRRRLVPDWTSLAGGTIQSAEWGSGLGSPRVSVWSRKLC